MLELDLGGGIGQLAGGKAAGDECDPTKRTMMHVRVFPLIGPASSAQARTPGSGLAKVERRSVHAIAQAARLRTVLEDVAEVAAAFGAVNLDANHT